MKKREEKIIWTIYHKEAASFFKSIGLSEKLRKGEILCSICGEIISLSNFRAVARKSGNLLFCCDKETCFQKFPSYLREKRNKI